MSPPDATPTPTATGRWLAAALAPPLALWLLRSVLRGRANADFATLQPLHAAVLVSDPTQALWAASRPLVLTALALAVAFWLLRRSLRAALRRHGWARVRPWLLALWLAACTLAGAALLASHLNRDSRHTLVAQDVRVLLAREIAPGTRHAGGTEVYFETAPGAPPLRLLAEQRPLADFAPGSTVRLHLQAGRWWGRWGRLGSADSR